MAEEQLSQLQEVELQSVEEGEAILSDGEGQRGQKAATRSSTIRRTKRRTLKKSSQQMREEKEEKEKKAEEKKDSPPITVEEVLSRMKRERDSVETQLSCLNTLERMVESTSDGTSHRTAVYKLGVADQVFAAMQCFHDNHDLATTGCWVISNFVIEASQCEAMVTGGVIPLVLQVMREHQSTDSLHAACAALCNIAVHEQWRLQLCREGGVELVAMAMKQCPQSEWVQYTATQTLQNICNTGSLCSEVVEKGGMESMLVAMGTMTDHEDLLQSACWALSSLAFNTNDGTRSRVCEWGGVERVVGALGSAPGHKGVQFTGCSALSNFARTDSLHPTMVDQGSVSVLVQAVSTFPSHQGILAVAFRALVLLANDDQAQLEMHQSDVLSKCEQTLSSFSDGPAFIEATQLRKLLSQQNRSCCTLF